MISHSIIRLLAPRSTLPPRRHLIVLLRTWLTCGPVNTARARFVACAREMYARLRPSDWPLDLRKAHDHVVFKMRMCMVLLQRPSRKCEFSPVRLSLDRSNQSYDIAQDWPRHKNECLSMAALSPAPVDPPPSMPFTSATFAAIIFPLDEQRPRIVHVECLAFIEPASSLMNWTPRVREHMQAGPHDAIGSLTIETGISEGTRDQLRQSAID